MPLERVIILIGGDGSGKTRHASNLISESSKSGKKCKYLWMRSAYFFSLPFMALCRILGFAIIHKLPNGRTCTEHLYYKKPIALIWPWVQLIDVLLFVETKIYAPLTRKNLLVVDRFVHDILVDVMVDVNNPNLYKSLVGRLMFRLVPKGAITFLFDVDEQTALQRKFDIPNPRYLTMRRRYYRYIAHHLKIVEIDSSHSFNTVHENLLARLKEQKAMLALDHFEKQLQNRLKARARWKKWKKGPIAIFKRLLKRTLYRLIGVRLPIIDAEISHNVGKDEFGRNMGRYFRSYIDLLRRRGIKIHTLILLGSRAKNRWKPRSDLDIFVIASGLPKGLTRRMSKYTRAHALSDIPLFLGIEAYGFTKEEFLVRLENLDLPTLDAICCGKVLFDDGFWLQVKRAYERIEDDYCLDTIKLQLELSMI
jgi:predicted nucleotidyltransferase